MTRYLISRICGVIIDILLASIIIFLAMHAAPGGPFDQEKMPLSDVQKQNILRSLGLDKPLYVQYLNYMRNALRGDFGVSYQYPGEEVLALIARVWPPSLLLGGLSLLLAFIIGIPLGILAALRENTWIDYTINAICLALASIPLFVISTALLMLVSVWNQWLPPGGWGEPSQVILPLLCFFFWQFAGVPRYTRSAMLEALHQDYVRTAKAKGLKPRTILWRHVFRNALNPMLTVFIPMIPNALTGTLFIESIFRIPGLGKFFVTSIEKRDYPMQMALTLMLTAIAGFMWIVIDVLYAVVDPRVRIDQ